MGYEEIPGANTIVFKDLSAGWFPGKQHNDIPGSLKTNEPLGMSSGNAVCWFRGALRSLFGYNNVTTSALNGGVTGLYASNVLDDMVVVAGSKIYKTADGAVPDDITGAVTLTPDIQMRFAEWQYQTDKYIIGVNGTDAPIKWTGTGNADVLGGTPPVAKWVAVFNNAVWLARTSAQPSTIYFSDLADPETYTANDDYRFDAPITGVGVLGDKLVVFKGDSIGVLVGDNNLLLTKVDRYIDGVGCSGGHTVVNAKIKGTSVLVFHSNNGFFAFDGSQTLIPLSGCIAEKYRTSSVLNKFNQSRFENATADYIPNYEWYVCCLSDYGDDTNLFMIIIDLSRVYETNEGIYCPHWPVDNIPANMIISSKSVTTNKNDIYFGDYSGYVHKFDETVFNYNGSTYPKNWVSKIFDNVQTWIINELNVIGDEENTTLTMYVKSNLESGSGQFGTIDMLNTGDLLGTDTILGTWILGSKDFVFADAGVDAFGRFMQLEAENTTINKEFSIEEINIVIQEIGLDPIAKQSD